MNVKRAFFNRQGAALVCFLLILLVPAGARDSPGGESGGGRVPPLISRLDNGDTLFVQYQGDVEYSRRRIFGRAGLPEDELAGDLTVYRYVPKEGEDLFSIAARCNIPYAGLATINRLVHPVLPRKELLLPSMPGIFVPSEPDSGIERLMAASRVSRGGGVDIRLGQDIFRFFPGDDYSPTERIFFLNRGFRFPLRDFTITSGFGPRTNPVTGRFRVHEGLDLAAPEGTDVFAVEAGVVTETGSDPVYGNYIVIKHGEDWASLYGHLSRIGVTVRQELRSGSVIGKVGSTGQSTGPHLHFELRRSGKAQDPGKYLFNQ
ncbi:MAG: M23 family metallopeptidase [Treponema sp.]|jgi:murein DD-endopeptidase MepM/ murein hydrolase activator NlpD|nr:M23 family metallopeptidase [Treponema sp.]